MGIFDASYLLLLKQVEFLVKLALNVDTVHVWKVKLWQQIALIRHRGHFSLMRKGISRIIVSRFRLWRQTFVKYLCNRVRRHSCVDGGLLHSPDCLDLLWYFTGLITQLAIIRCEVLNYRLRLFHLMTFLDGRSRSIFLLNWFWNPLAVDVGLDGILGYDGALP